MDGVRRAILWTLRPRPEENVNVTANETASNSQVAAVPSKSSSPAALPRNSDVGAPPAKRASPLPERRVSSPQRPQWTRTSAPGSDAPSPFGRLNANAMSGASPATHSPLSSPQVGVRRLSLQPGERRVHVCVRKRPLNARERSAGAADVVAVDGRRVVVAAQRVRVDGITKYVEEQPFSFDTAFGDGADNAAVYAGVVEPIVSFCVAGGPGGARGTVLAYGQTGSGKTHTMFGPGGVVQRAAEAFLAWGPAELSFYEIYQGVLYDLLAERRRLAACEGADGRVAVLNVARVSVDSGPGARDAIAAGLECRRLGTTGANAASSRSHAVLQLARGTSVLTFVDLAGSERGADRAETDRKTRLEGAEINRSLLALKECIRALDSAHTPFRTSKLTLVLRDAIAGAEAVRTAMIATVSPSSACFEHTLNTLRYAARFLDVSGGSDTQAAVLGVEPRRYDLETGETSVVAKNAHLLPQPNHELPAGTIKPEAAPNSKFSSGRISTALPGMASGARDTPHSRAGTARRRAAAAMADLQRLVATCRDADMLDLLGEELESLLSAFRSLH